MRQGRDTDNKADPIGKSMDRENGVFLGVKVKE
jgi:hypothetical protein